MKYLLLLLISFIFFTGSCHSQLLNKHKWKNRIVILISNSEDTIISNKLISEIEEDTVGLKERKLIIYKVFPKYYTLKTERFDGEELYALLNPENADFKFILIGLDGRTKVEEDKSLSKAELYKIIDAMPMRASELKNKQ